MQPREPWKRQSPETVTLHVYFRTREARRPEGNACARQRTAAAHETDNALIKGLARAFRWKRMLESGEFATIAELAEREGIAPSYLTRVLRLTLLAPEIVEAIMDGGQPEEITLRTLLQDVPLEWKFPFAR